MKTLNRLLITLLGAGLVACSSPEMAQEHSSYKGEILLSKYEAGNLKLTIRKNDCRSDVSQNELVEVRHQYDGNLVVGACVVVQKDQQGQVNITNISRSRSSVALSRTGQY